MKRTRLLSLLLLPLTACGGDRGAGPRTSVVAAGDIASCWWRADEATARLLDRIDGVVLAVGDLAYQNGTPQQFARCYGPTWGRHRDRTRPVPGNHEYRTDGEGYWTYFGDRAGQRGKGWYSFEVDGWHVVALNSEEPMEEGSEQLEWLRRDLRAHPTRCALAYMHHPAFSSGKHGAARRVQEVFRVLYDGGVDVLLSGHEHSYERFAPQAPGGRLDRRRGVRQFVVGTGGAPTYPFRELAPNSEAANYRTHGVLRLVFHGDGYEWEFVPVRGHSFTDRGRGTCSPPVKP
ncbi:MAG TPA: metallophosphoesterase [Longimicrobium sp.]